MSDCSSIHDRFFGPNAPARGDPELEAHLASCERCRAAADALPLVDAALAAPFPEVSVPPFETVARAAASAARARRRERTARQVFPFFATGFAAAAAAAIVALVITARNHPRPAVVAPGAQLETTSAAKVAQLESGTRIRLDAGRVVRVPAARGQEKLRLESGSVSLEVPKLPEGHAVMVATRDAEVLVHGTRFTVARDARATTVSVTEGVVEVRPAGPGREPAFVHAGESVTVESLESYRASLREAAQSALDVGQFPVAEGHLRSWLATEPESTERAEIQALLAWAAAASGNRAAAIERYRASLAALPVDERPLWAENACSELALLLEQDDAASAAAAWGEYLRRFPDGVHSALARTRLAHLREP